MSLGSRPRDDGGSGKRRLPSSAPKIHGITITLSDTQVRRVLREVTGASESRLLLEQVDGLRVAIAAVLADPGADERRISLSTLRALGVLFSFTPEGTTRSIKEIAREQKLNDSTVYRYLQTWVKVGLLEWIPHIHKYRLLPPDVGASGSDATE